MTRSTFFCDGYRDAEQGNTFSPLGFSVYCAEYTRGYNSFFETEQDALKARDAGLRAARAYRNHEEAA